MHPPQGAVNSTTGAVAQFVEILSLNVGAAGKDGVFL